MNHAAQDGSALLGRELGECTTKNELGYDKLVAGVDLAGDTAFQLNYPVGIAMAESPQDTLPPPHLSSHICWRGFAISLVHEDKATSVALFA